MYQELEQLICNFFDRGIIRFNLEKGFELAAHRQDPGTPLSPLYYNLRTADNKGGPLQPADVVAVTRLLRTVIKRDNIQFAGIAPVLNAGRPFAVELQDMLYHAPGHRSVPILHFEKGTGNLQRHPDLAPGNFVLLLDDVFSSGRSKEPLVKGIRAGGYRVEHCLVFANRSSEGERFLMQLGVHAHWVTTARETLNILKSNAKISHDEFEQACQHMAA